MIEQCDQRQGALSVRTRVFHMWADRSAAWGLVAGVACLGAAGPAVAGPSGGYAIARRADSTQLSGSQFFPPALNAAGTVALSVDQFALYTIAAPAFPGGQPPAPVSVDVSAAGFVLFPVLNASGTIVFFGVSGQQIFSALPGLPAVEVLSASFLNAPALNDAGTIAYRRGSIPGGVSPAIYTLAPGGSPVPIISASPGGTGFREFGPFVGLSSTGVVCFIGFPNSGGGGIYRVAPAGTPMLVANTAGIFASFENFGAPAINTDNVVAFRADLDNGGSGVYRASPGQQPQEIATNLTLSGGVPNGVTLNTSGQVAFSVDFNDGTNFDRRIFVSTPGRPLQRVAGHGDALDGSTIASINWPQIAFNDAGQIAFVAGLADGRQGVFVATPCLADFNGVGGVTALDIFDFLNAWFAGTPSADFNGVGGLNVDDIFAFLGAWFAGC